MAAKAIITNTVVTGPEVMKLCNTGETNSDNIYYIANKGAFNIITICNNSTEHVI